MGNDLVRLDRLEFRFLFSFLVCQEVLHLPNLLLGQIVSQHCVSTSEEVGIVEDNRVHWRE